MNRVFCLRVLPLLLACALLSVPALAGEAADGMEGVPPARVMDVNDVMRVMQRAKGKVMVLNFWASWCGPCRMERRELMALRDAIPAEDMMLLGLSVDQDPAAYAQFVAGNGFNYPVRLAAESVVRLFSIGSIPRLMVYDPDGKLAVDHEGLVGASQLKSTVNDLLQGR
ncbi:TlpA family protein disulfide reductase [Desulfocurvus sp. DL9XJH121]